MRPRNPRCAGVETATPASWILACDVVGGGSDSRRGRNRRGRTGRNRPAPICGRRRPPRTRGRGLAARVWEMPSCVEAALPPGCMEEARMDLGLGRGKVSGCRVLVSRRVDRSNGVFFPQHVAPRDFRFRTGSTEEGAKDENQARCQILGGNATLN